jgi:citrate lyase synthetase
MTDMGSASVDIAPTNPFRHFYLVRKWSNNCDPLFFELVKESDEFFDCITS